jgi:HSP20 family molecular chaperone IbpA
MTQRRDIDRLQREIEGLFSDLWQVPRYVRGRRGFRPDVDCYSTEDPPALTVVVDVAGADAESLHVHATPTALLVRGERRREPVRGAVYHQMEVEYGSFDREIRLPAAVDARRAEASLANGLLTITLPLARRPVRKTVPVELRLG